LISQLHSQHSAVIKMTFRHCFRDEKEPSLLGFGSACVPRTIKIPFGLGYCKLAEKHGSGSEQVP